VPPRHTFDEDTSDDEDSGLDAPGRQVAEYQDDGEVIPRPKHESLALDNIMSHQTEEIRTEMTVVIGIERLSDVDRWLGPSRQIGTFAVESVFLIAVVY